MKPDATLSDIRTEMDARYKNGTGAYERELAFDRLRTDEIFRVVRALAEWGTHKGPLHTLDVGSGVGGIAEYWPHHDIVGVELSGVAVEQARQRFPDVRYECSAIEEWKTDDKFSMVVAVETIEHWSDVDRALDVIRGCMHTLAPLIVTSPNRDSLHCRIGNKLKINVPYCSRDHTHEFGFQELIDRVTAHGFRIQASAGVLCAPYWALEQSLGTTIRSFTDKDEEVNRWLIDIGRTMPPEYAFLQAHRFVAI